MDCHTSIFSEIVVLTPQSVLGYMLQDSFTVLYIELHCLLELDTPLNCYLNTAPFTGTDIVYIITDVFRGNNVGNYICLSIPCRSNIATYLI